jgi:hypothetical protein
MMIQTFSISENVNLFDLLGLLPLFNLGDNCCHDSVAFLDDVVPNTCVQR